jgi:F-type H+-transporting ATPase subunit delta
MRDRKLATRYARALLGALPDAAGQNLADQFLNALAAGLRNHADLRAFFLDPANPPSSKKTLLEKLCGSQGMPAALARFLGMVSDNGRLASLSSIAEVFHLEREAAQNTISATLTSAAPLTPELRTRAKSALEKLSGRTVNLEVAVDPGLLGGAVTRLGSMVYDGSLKTQLARLRRTMGEE